MRSLQWPPGNVPSSSGGLNGNADDLGPAGLGGFAAPVVLVARVGASSGKRCFAGHQTRAAAPGDRHGGVHACDGGRHISAPACSGGLHGNDHHVGPNWPGGFAAKGIVIVLRGTGSGLRCSVRGQTNAAAPGGLSDNVNDCAQRGNVNARAGGQHDYDQGSGPAGPGGCAAPCGVLIVRVGTAGGKR